MKRILNLGTRFVNTYLVELKDGWLLVDSGYPFSYPRFLREAKKNKIELSSIRYVALTHVHADHAGFLKKILDVSGATLLCLSSEGPRLLSGENEKNVYVSKNTFWIQRFSAATDRLQTFEPLDISDATDPLSQPLTDQGVSFFVLHGHTDNDLCFRVDDKLFVGDICMNSFFAKYHAPVWIEDNEKLTESWKKLLETEGEFIYPGHGKPFPKRELAKYVRKQEQKKLRKLYKK